ncbi:XRE family transcriptional regulator [Cryobacterium sp. Hh11]|uniref:helix-turn-helix domain-containing protein n=1 Tax=Cryobacterium sp. Hh11 TaxID=2555868 RepID=UPI001069A168|nr:helix-turn-helix transcriptional regulator [Cryobacterium sp. Hh11]TFD48718.1 XRE family transcriptional regulator [Cryobacterium sp. Hh11]
MNKTLPYDPGAKIAKYRKKLKLTAEEVAEKAGFGLTRSIVANLENGRKDDITVRQLIAIAFVLQVSPATLVFDVRKPYHQMVLTGGENFEASVAVWAARDWFGGLVDPELLHASVNGEPYDGQAKSGDHWIEQLITETLHRRMDLLRQLRTIEDRYAALRASMTEETGSDMPEGMKSDVEASRRVIHAELYTTDRALRASGVYLDDDGPGF